MIKKVGLSIAVIIFCLLICTSCVEQEQPPTSSSVGGSLLKTGREIDENLEITTTDVRYRVDEEFYFFFHNNMPFDTDKVMVMLINNKNDNVLAESEYDVHPDSKTITDKIWFGSPGRYSIIVKVGDQTRAVQEVIIADPSN